MKAFIMSVDTACAVWEAFIMAEAVKEEERLDILAKLVVEGKVESMEINATKEEVMEELVKTFNVWKAERTKNG